MLNRTEYYTSAENPAAGTSEEHPRSSFKNKIQLVPWKWLELGSYSYSFGLHDKPLAFSSRCHAGVHTAACHCQATLMAAISELLSESVAA